MVKSDERRRTGRKSRKSSKKLHRKLWRKLKRMMISESAPKEYRPFLGHEASKEDVERLKFKNTRAKLNKFPRKPQKNKLPFLLSFTSRFRKENTVNSRYVKKSDEINVQRVTN